MIEAKVIWTDNHRFLGQASSGHGIVVDGDSKTGSSPMELVLIGLCGCTGYDVASILGKKREPFTSIEVRAEGDRAADSAHGLYGDPAGLSSRGKGLAQSGRRCGPVIRREVLLGCGYAEQDGEDQLRDRIHGKIRGVYHHCPGERIPSADIYTSPAPRFCGAWRLLLGEPRLPVGFYPRGQALRPIDPLILSQSRATFSFIVLLIALVLIRGWKRLRVPLADFRRMFVLGILGVAASNYLYYLAIQRTNVATAIILQYTAPILVLLYTVARGLQKPTMQRVAAVALAVTGIALVIGVFGAGGFPAGRDRSIRGVGGGVFFRFLQHRRPQHPCPLRSLDGVAVCHPERVAYFGSL